MLILTTHYNLHYNNIIYSSLNFEAISMTVALASHQRKYVETDLAVMMMKFMFNVAAITWMVDDEHQDRGLELDYNAVGLMSNNVSLYIHGSCTMYRQFYVHLS